MDETTYQAIAMIVYFVGMLAIGGWAYGRNNDLDDYMLADRGACGHESGGKLPP